MRIILFKHFPPGSNLAAVALLALFLGACAGSGGGPPGETVRIVTAEQLTDCRNVGSVHVSVIDKLQQQLELYELIFDSIHNGAIVTDAAGEEVVYHWVLSRQSEGEYKDCWMTDGVLPVQHPGERNGLIPA